MDEGREDVQVGEDAEKRWTWTSSDALVMTGDRLAAAPESRLSSGSVTSHEL